MRAMFDLLVLLVNVYMYDPPPNELQPSQTTDPTLVEGILLFQKITMQTLAIHGRAKVEEIKA